MTRQFDRVGNLARAMVHEAQTERITFMAGTIAYNAFLSLLPLLFLLLAIVSIVGGTALEDSMTGLTEALVTPGVASIFVDELKNASVGASVIGIVALVWGMLRIFRSLDMAFSDIYETQVENTLPDQFKDSFVVFGSIATLLTGVIGLESVFSFSDASGLFFLVHRLLAVCIIAVALTPLYYLFPDAPDMAIREVVPGVAFTATALVILQSIFGFYVAYSDPTADNQLLGSIVMLLTWFYFCGLVILFGAVVNAVLSNRSADINVDPVLGGVPKETVSDLDIDGQHVPEAALQRLRHSLDDATRMLIRFDHGPEVDLPAPDIVTIDADTAAVPVINDTAVLELQWAEATAENPAHE